MAGNLTAMIAAAFSGGAAPPVTSDPYYEYTTLLLPGNGTNGAQNNTFLDGSTNNFTITRNGNTTQGTFSPFSQTGWGNYFDGSSGYLTTPANTAFAFGTGDFTVEMFVNTSNLTTGGFVSHGPAATSGYWMFELSGGSFFWQASGVANILVVSASSYLSNSVWTHLCVSRVSGTTRMFANGTQIASATDNTNYSGSSSGSLSIGRSYNGTYTTGYISNLRIVKGTGVTTVTVPTAPLTAISGTSILTCQSNRFIDNSTNNFTITRNGNASVVAFSPFNPSASWSAATYGGSGYFDGSGDYLTVPDNAALELGTSNFTIELWVYPTVFTANYLIGKMTNSLTASGFLIRLADTTGVALFYASSNGLSWDIAGGIGSVAVTLNAWNHIAVSRSGSSFRLWVNGSSGGTATSASAIQNNTAVVGIGDVAGGGGPTTGYISNARIVNGSAVYDPSQSTITVPTAPLTAITNTSLLLNFTNAGIYDATSKNDLETVGNAQISTTQSKWGGSSMSFDGTGDYLAFRDSDLFAFGSGDLTIECWVYATTSGLSQGIAGQANSSVTASATSFILYLSSISKITVEFYVGSTLYLVTSSNNLVYNQWNHIAVVRDGGTIRLYINGQQDGTVAISGTINDSTNQLAIGRPGEYNSWYWNGYIQDFRITKGYARYTANFTAPTAAFPTL